ncbi:hypothetical protein D3C80_1141480 [compost metagenome]
MEVAENLGEAAHTADVFQQGTPRIDTDGGQPPGLQELALAQRGTRGQQAQPGEGAEDDLGQRVEVADDEGEGADVERLLDQPGGDVLAAHGPEQPGQGHVDGYQGQGEKGHLAAEQAEARVDVLAEHLEEAVDHADVVHRTSSSKLGGMAGRLSGVRNSPA